MANHKRRRPKTSRAGCLMCKPWKVPGSRRDHREKFSDLRRRTAADQEIHSAA